MIRYLTKVWYILKGSRKSLPWLILTFSLSSLLEALGIGLIGPFLNLASNPEHIQKIPVLHWAYIQFNVQSTSQFIGILGLVIAALFCIKSLLYFLSQYYIFSFSFKQKAKLVSRLLTAYLSMPYTSYLRKNTATLAKNITHDTMMINLACVLPLLGSISNITVVFVLLMLLANTNKTLLTGILAILAPTFLIFYLLKNQAKAWGKETSQSHEGMIKIINQGLGSLKETRVIGCEVYFQEQMQQNVQKYITYSTKFNSFNSLPRIVIETTLMVFTLLFISISQIFFATSIQEVTSSMAVFAVASIRLIPAISQILQAMGQLQNGSHSVDVLYSDLKEIENQEIKAFQPLPTLTKHNFLDIKYENNSTMPFTNKIEINNISYYYPETETPALENISLTIKKGESIALIGKSGAGKTTLVDVILGLLSVDTGEIQVDNVSIYKNIRYWQNLIGYIPQSIFLIDDTIERNIAFGVPDHLIDVKRLNNAIKAAQLQELVEQLPNGIKTSVGERGVRLSGGQRQRIGIARAIYHEREIIVLDEATSALDNETEKLVSQAINSLAGTKTLIIIAHRLSTIEHCDRVYVLDKGRLIKSGSYQEVV